jgi:GT2 family glycosyltransferase
VCDVPLYKIYADDVNEVIANNIGLKKSSCEYSLLIQDDMLIMEKDFDKRLLKPFSIVKNLLGVTGRDAVDAVLRDEKIDFVNVSGKDVNTPRNIFAIRNAINRGPMLIENAKLKELGYLDEDYAPIALDDVDLCLRANRLGYVVGSYVINYQSDNSWGTTRRSFESARLLSQSEKKNLNLLIQRHYDILNSKNNGTNIIIEE